MITTKAEVMLNKAEGSFFLLQSGHSLCGKESRKGDIVRKKGNIMRKEVMKINQSEKDLLGD